MYCSLAYRNYSRKNSAPNNREPYCLHANADTLNFSREHLYCLRGNTIHCRFALGDLGISQTIEEPQRNSMGGFIWILVDLVFRRSLFG